MRLFSSLLLAAFGGVLSAAPAAKLSLPAPEPRETEAESTQQPAPDESKPAPAVASARVVLHKAEHGEESSSAGPVPADLTPDTPPRLRARKLARVRPPHPPIDTASGDDLRAGLLAIPPPLA